MTYAEKKSLGLILSAADRLEAHQIAAEIAKHGGSAERWDRADRTPALNAAVNQLVAHGEVGPCKCHVFTASDSLEQFYRFGEMGMSRGGRVWERRARRTRAVAVVR